MNIFVNIILAIIKKNFLFFKPFKRIREKFGILAELNHKYKGQKTGTIGQTLSFEQAYFKLVEFVSEGLS